jgi:hypothetical protein
VEHRRSLDAGDGVDGQSPGQVLIQGAVPLALLAVPVWVMSRRAAGRFARAAAPLRRRVGETPCGRFAC